MWPDTDVYRRAHIESAICSRLKHPPAKYGVSVSYNHTAGAILVQRFSFVADVWIVIAYEIL